MTVTEPVQIPLVNGRGFALVDAADAELVSRYRWRRDARPNGKIYACAWVTGRPVPKSVRMHVLLMGHPGIDHVNGDGLDNQRHNLRPATKSQNGANLRPYENCTSRFKGVYWFRRDGIWVAQIEAGGRRRYLGRFVNEEDAARTYDAAAHAAWGEYALLNFPMKAAP